jgi:hypothetical protein
MLRFDWFYAPHSINSFTDATNLYSHALDELEHIHDVMIKIAEEDAENDDFCVEYCIESDMAISARIVFYRGLLDTLFCFMCDEMINNPSSNLSDDQQREIQYLGDERKEIESLALFFLNQEAADHSDWKPPTVIFPDLIEEVVCEETMIARNYG